MKLPVKTQGGQCTRHAGGWDVPSRAVCVIQSIAGVTTVLAGWRQGWEWETSADVFPKFTCLGADTREGHKCWTVPLLSVDWFCCETLAFCREGVQSCLLSGYSEEKEQVISFWGSDATEGSYNWP